MNIRILFARRFFFLWAIVSLFCVPLFSSAQVGNVPSGAFIIKPAKVELVLAKGESKESVLTLSNSTALPLRVDVSFEDVAPSAQTSPTDEPIKLLGKNGGAYALSDLLSTQNSTFELLSGDDIQVPITVTIPKDLEPGGRYGSVVFTFRPIMTPGTVQSANIAIESRVATTFFVRISGETKEEGKLAAFGLFNNARLVTAPSEEVPLRFQVAYENTGDVHLNPYGQITFHPFLGSERVALIDPWVVLPGATRMREVVTGEDLSVGYYRAHIELNRGYGNIVDEEEVSFWVVPQTQDTILLIIIFLILILIVRRSLRISKHRAF